MRQLLALALCLGIAPLPRLAAQWSVALEAAASYYGGASRDTAADPTAIRPHHPTGLGVRVDRRLGRLGVGVAAALARPDVIVENSGAGAILKGALDLYEIAPEATVLVSRASSVVAVRVHAGPLIDIWSPSGEGTRTRLGGHAGLSLECPIGGRFAGSIRAGGALTGSLFDDGELPSGFERRAMWRSSVALSLRYRL
ncbi:MAG TPA: hypothetical protein VEM13_05445 [Gemmatimonadales bacterium]|nr:hypothetical protein [Gemmatimonadales bacterium]